MIYQKCCHNQDKEKGKKIHYEKLGEFQDDKTEENDMLINLAAMLNALENKEMKRNKIQRNLKTDFTRFIPLRQIKMICGEDGNKKITFNKINLS